MKERIDTFVKWFKPFLTKQNIVMVACCVVAIAIVIILGIFVL